MAGRRHETGPNGTSGAAPPLQRSSSPDLEPSLTAPNGGSSKPKSVEITPHFTVLRNFAEVYSAIKGLCEDRMPRPPYNINLAAATEILSTQFGDVEQFGHTELLRSAVEKTASMLERAKQSPVQQSIRSSNAPNDSFTMDRGASIMFLSEPPARPASTASPTPAPPRRKNPKILCIWDIDETLVCTGSRGVRQNPVFRESDLLNLFQKVSGSTRHLLLSQGSIDDVFESHNNLGRLQYLRPFFAKGTNEQVAAPEATRPERHVDPELESAGVRGIFGCTKSATKVKTASSAPKRRKTDPTTFEEGTVVVRLSVVGSPPETEQEADCLFDPNVEPQASDVRWLILRPGMWGITLSSLSNYIPPSPHTAFVDGKMFHKMDIVWSLAATGEWDTVFFMDNNISEIGIVRYGLKLTDIPHLRETHHFERFFQGEYLLIAAAARLREMERIYGRDPLEPPPPGRRNTTGSGGGKAKSSREANTPPPPPPAAAAAAAAATSSSSKAAAGNVAAKAESNTSSSQSVTNGTGTTAATTEVPELDAVASASLASVRVNEIDEDIDVDVPVSSASKGMPPTHGDDAGRTMSEANKENGVQDRKEAIDEDDESRPATPTAPVPPVSAEERCKPVHLVVAHFHMNVEQYRRVLLGSHPEEQQNRRALSTFAVSPGQPTFVGDLTCSDDQYEELLRSYRNVECSIFQLMNEDMRQNGFIDVKQGKKWRANPRIVHVPLYRRPTRIPHLGKFFQRISVTVDKQVVQPLLSGSGKLEVSLMVRSVTAGLFQKFLRCTLVLDPQFIFNVAYTLFVMYTGEGKIPKTLAENLRKYLKDMYDGSPSKK